MAKLIRWSVDLIRKKAQHLGTIEAPDERTAIAKAAEEFAIEPARRNKIAVTKLDERKR
jgi:1,2-phenylacetyl-CoA epoxidase PaaB subunit